MITKKQAIEVFEVVAMTCTLGLRDFPLDEETKVAIGRAIIEVFLACNQTANDAFAFGNKVGEADTKQAAAAGKT